LFDEDFSVFFNANEFAVEALIQGHSISGYLSKAYSTLQEHPSHRRHFSFLWAAQDIAFVSSGDFVLIEKICYQIVGIQSDDTGLATLTFMFIEKLSCS
jgi:hypothetical protein